VYYFLILSYWNIFIKFVFIIGIKKVS
jgi:hypothetical protein